MRKKTSAERRANGMIALNVMVYLFYRLPELAGVFFVYFYREQSNGDLPCSYADLCYFVASTIEYFYMLSYIFNIIFYRTFNSNFEKGLRNFFGVKKGEISKKP